jgi:hypothetical protein
MDARSTFDGEQSLGHSCSYVCRVLAERDWLRVGRDSFSVREQASRRVPLVPVMQSTDFRKFEYGADLPRLNGA